MKVRETGLAQRDAKSRVTSLETKFHQLVHHYLAEISTLLSAMSIFEAVH